MHWCNPASGLWVGVIGETLALDDGLGVLGRVLCLHGCAAPAGLAGSNALVNAGVGAGLWRVCHACAYGIEINVRHAGHDSLLVEQGRGVKSPFPEGSRTAVFFISHAGERFFDGFHEPSEVGQTGPVFCDPGRIISPRLQNAEIRWEYLASAPVAQGIDGCPALGDSHWRPVLGKVRPSSNDEVQMIGHDREGQYLDAKSRCALFNTIFDPLSAVFAGCSAAEGGTANVPVD